MSDPAVYHLPCNHADHEYCPWVGFVGGVFSCHATLPNCCHKDIIDNPDRPGTKICASDLCSYVPPP
eukprot:g38728.t1